MRKIDDFYLIFTTV